MQRVVRRNCVFFLSAFRRGDTKGLKFVGGFQDWRPVCIPPPPVSPRGGFYFQIVVVCSTIPVIHTAIQDFASFANIVVTGKRPSMI